MTKINVLLADPPWTYRDKLQMTDGVSRSSDEQYNTLSTDEIVAFLALNGPSGYIGHEAFPTDELRFRDQIATDALLFLWATNPFILDGTAQRVCHAWGFEPKQMVPWIKGRLTVDGLRGAGSLGQALIHAKPELVLHTGMGFYTRGVSEHLIIATRGQATSLVKDRGVNGLILAPEQAFILAPRGAHSSKPEESYQLIERLVGPDVPKMELFARKRRDGWEQYGDQLK